MQFVPKRLVKKKPTDIQQYAANELDMSDEALVKSKANLIVRKNLRAKQAKELAMLRAQASPIRKANKQRLYELWLQEEYDWNRATLLLMRERGVTGSGISKAYCEQLKEELRKEKSIGGKAEPLLESAFEEIIKAKDEINDLIPEDNEDAIAKAYARLKVAERMMAVPTVKKILEEKKSALIEQHYHNTDNRKIEIKIGKTDENLKQIAQDFGITVEQAKGLAQAKAERERNKVIDINE